VAREEQRERRRRRRRGIPSFGGEGRFFCEGFPSRTCCKKVFWEGKPSCETSLLSRIIELNFDLLDKAEDNEGFEK